MPDDPRKTTQELMLAHAQFKKAMAELQNATNSLSIAVIQAGMRYYDDPIGLFNFHNKYMPQATARTRAYAATIMALVDQINEEASATGDDPEDKPGDNPGENSGGDPDTFGA